MLRADRLREISARYCIFAVSGKFVVRRGVPAPRPSLCSMS
ncbi:hypothetical protein SSBG_06539 [Streptomyces sp. SPB074]|nr:hypothetical protein SSBG_06539 [Streptomyces sp. SPB074]